jgi:hypothetical protein
LQESQKLESLGLLTGGVAHGFNNFLTGVIGHASTLAEEFPAGSARWEKIQSVIEAANAWPELPRKCWPIPDGANLSSRQLIFLGRSFKINSLIHASIGKMGNSVCSPLMIGIVTSSSTMSIP